MCALVCGLLAIFDSGANLCLSFGVASGVFVCDSTARTVCPVCTLTGRRTSDELERTDVIVCGDERNLSAVHFVA